MGVVEPCTYTFMTSSPLPSSYRTLTFFLSRSTSRFPASILLLAILFGISLSPSSPGSPPSCSSRSLALPIAVWKSASGEGLLSGFWEEEDGSFVLLQLLLLGCDDARVWEVLRVLLDGRRREERDGGWGC
jgi:hypothetical protein